MKTVVLFVACSSMLFCSCGKKNVSWEYAKVKMPDEAGHTTSIGSTPSYSVFIQMRESKEGEEALKGYMEMPNENSPEDVLRAIGDEGWELAWMSPDQKEFYVKRHSAKLGHFIVQEKFKEAK
jgi:hypothetical protein